METFSSVSLEKQVLEMSAEAHCKGCGGPMTEGRAYELGNHRWHVECFRCSNCDDQLTAHTNMLVLGDGTLVCANCSYTCAVCSKKIMDMAVLTNDQAFCASCFVCRNCKKRIDDLQYARTSQGIFCMSCHNALLARKRQRQLQRQQMQKAVQQQNTPPRQSQLQDISSHGLNKNENINSTGENSNPTSSKSSIVSSSSFNRNKGLPILPNETSPEQHSEDGEFSSLSLSVYSERPNNTRQISGGKEGRQLRVPRKQLAPSAFQSNGTSTASSSTQSLLDRPTSSQMAPEKPITAAKVLENTLGTPPPKSQKPSDNVKASPTAPLTAAAVGSDDQAPPPPASYTFADPISAPMSIGTPPRSPMQSETPTPEAARTLGTPNYLSPEASNLNVPLRSQFRPVSPAKVPKSPAASDFSSRTNSSIVRSPTQFGNAAYTPYDHGTASPTQAAAPSNQQVRSPFSRWWHKRTVSSTSQDSNSQDLFAPSLPNHRRSASENQNTEPELPYTEDRGVNDALAALSIERARVSEMEKKLNQYKEQDDIQANIDELRQQLTKLKDEHKLLTSRNHQLSEMNAELERQTLEKFGPNSLWGSQNPAPLNPQDLSSSTAPTLSSSNSGGFGKDAPKESPLVTRLDDPQHTSSSSSGGNGSTSQAQFLPLKTAKQWFFRRPNRPGAGVDRGQVYQPGVISGTQYTPAPNGSFSNTNSGVGRENETGNNGSSGNSNVPSNTILGDHLCYRAQVDQSPVPYFVTRCFAEVERRGLDTEGVYRKPGSKSQVDSILEQFGPNGDPALGEELLRGDIQAVTSAVKQYLRYLSDPVITYDCYEAYIAAGNSKNLKVLRKSIEALPVEHLATLKVVVSHLALVASHEKTNLMNTRNLAMVFAPTLARDENGDREIPDMQARNEATHMLIVNAHALLDPIDELL